MQDRVAYSGRVMVRLCGEKTRSFEKRLCMMPP